MNIAFIDWSLNIDCPHCEEVVDLVQYESDIGDNSIAGRIFTNRWDEIKGHMVECPYCHQDFLIDRVEY
jgi:uncharacterized Zn-finger protein